MKAIINVQELTFDIPQGVFGLADGLSFEEANLEGRLLSTRGGFQYSWKCTLPEETFQEFFPKGYQPRTEGITLYNVKVGINHPPATAYFLEIRRGHDVYSRFADGTPRERYTAYIGFDGISSSRPERLANLKNGLEMIRYYPEGEVSPLEMSQDNFPVGEMLGIQADITIPIFTGPNRRRIGRLLFSGNPLAQISGFAVNDFVCFSLEAYKGPYSILDSKTNQIWTTDWNGGNYVIRLPR